MPPVQTAKIADAFNSMLRTDYISLNDTEKLNLLAKYYVDYFGHLPQILSESDLLIVGRRGTGKTTLLYRALVESMRSWQEKERSIAKPRTLGIYVDLSKCQSLESLTDDDFAEFEHAVVTEICEALDDQLTRFWPALASEPGRFYRLFKATEARRVKEVREILSKIATLLQEGVPRLVDRSAPVSIKESKTLTSGETRSLDGSLSAKDPTIKVGASDQTGESSTTEKGYTTKTTYRLMVSDIFRLLADLREKAGLSAIHLFIDEYSALSETMQRRFSTLLRKMLGSHAGVFVKICAITDKYVLGSSIILQRDLFEMSLDLDAYVERSGTLNEAMEGLREQARAIVSTRLETYGCPPPEQLFDAPDDAWTVLSRSAMGVPRTLGIVLQKAWSRALMPARSNRILKSDVTYGINYASKAYLNQLLGAARGGIAIPEVHLDIWNALLERAQIEHSKVPDVAASHFLVLEKHEEMLKMLNMFFLVHLVEKNRTTKKEKSARSLYCFDYGITEEYNLGYTTHKNVIRQQRFAYDTTLAPFEPFFRQSAEVGYRCPVCNSVYKSSELQVAGIQLSFCPKDRAQLISNEADITAGRYTEEEIKIIGAIRSASREDQRVARHIADDVGCHVQKVSKFGEKLDREGLIERDRAETQDKLVYFHQGEQ